MNLNLFKIKKWTNMLLGKSVYHVNQDEGKCYSRDDVCGYYNNLTEKVTKFEVNNSELPKVKIDSGEELYLPCAIFQYGLGAYDLYLINHDKRMFDKFVLCVEWAMKNQEANGGWRAFDFENKEKPFSSMTQGQGISLLMRMYKESGEMEYINSAKSALNLMLLPIEQGGTTFYEGKNIFLYECTYEPLILNGWIFSIWGLIDYCKINNDDNIKKVLETTMETLEGKLCDYDIDYWSMYSCHDKIASPFYHRLHIAQLRVMFDLTGREIYKLYADKWERYNNSLLKKSKAFIIKAVQKILEK